MLKEHIYNSEHRNLSCFLLILFFTLSPGIVKATGNQAFFIIGYVCLAAFLAITTEKLKIKKLNLSKFAAVVLLIYGLTISVINSNMIGINDDSIVIGIAIFILPILMAICSDAASTIRLLRFLPWIGLFHALLALIIYPYLPFSALFGDFFSPILEGVMAFRMASVSGSLAFASLMATSFAVCIIKSRFSSDHKINYFIASILILICLILSLQRSMWLVTLIFIVYGIFYNFIRKKTLILALIFFTTSATVFLAQFGDLLSSFSDLIFDRIFSVTSQSDDSPIGERVDQWVGIIKNIEALPFGAGVGQLGQANREGPFPVGLSGIPDGDYFRMVSEYGPFGLILVFIIFFKVGGALHILVTKKMEWYSYAAAIVLCILAFQGVGSNMTELYFINFLFFAVLLNFKKIIDLKIYYK